jgi:hypothetical protein
MIVLVLFLGGPDFCASAAHKGKRGAVSIVFFYSKECEHCHTVERLLKSLKRAYPVRLKKFDIDIPHNYQLFEKLEAIHAGNGFAVPLVIVGESIFTGERDIRRNLEAAVRTLARSGGAPFPYLGPKSVPKGQKAKETARPRSSGCNCDERRPPTLREEWNNIRALLDRVL